MEFNPTKWDGNPDTTIRYVLKSADGRTKQGPPITVRHLAQSIAWAEHGDPLDVDGTKLADVVRSIDKTRAQILAKRQREAEIARQSTAAPPPTPKPQRVPSPAEHEERAAEKRLRVAVEARLEEMGAEWIRAAAGYANAYPSLGNLASSAANAAAKAVLEPHVQPFAVAEKRKFRPHMTRRDHDRHKAALDRATTQWTRYFAKARKQLTDAVHAAAWPPYRDELRARTARIEKELVAAAERKAKTGMTFDVPIRRKSNASSKPQQPTPRGKDVGRGPGEW